MTDTKTIKVGLLGLGTVGTGVYKLIGRRSEEMQQKTGAALEIKKILVHNMKKVRQGVDQNLLTDQWKEIIEDDEIQIVIEVMGGIEPAKTMITEALKAGKNVVSANKDLIAEYGKELYDAAKEGSADFLFEAAVAGGIPIIRPLKQCLEGNQIDEIMGIVNGTTNYILTKMFEDGMDFTEALAKATELGYAEADPTADVEGLHGDAVGDTMFYGRGAGELPTASAVVGDVMDVTRNIVWNCTGRIGWSAYKELPIKEFADVKNRFFIRMQVSNEPGVLAAIAKVFGDHKVSIERVIQEQAKAAKAELVIGTSAVKEYHLQDALEELKEMPIVSEISSIIREY